MAPATYVEFVKALQGQSEGSATFNWDVAVTYEATSLNALLAQEHKKPSNRPRPTIALQYSIEDFSGGTITYRYTLVLGPPLIQFSAKSDAPSCSLQIRVLHGTMIADKGNGNPPVTQFASENFVIKVSNISLESITASGSPSNAENKKSPLVFLDNTSTNQLVVNFDIHGDPNLVIDTSGISHILGPMNSSAFKNTLRAYFDTEISSIQYVLAVPSPPNISGVDLVPRDLCVVCTGDSERSYLTLLISTSSSTGSGNKTQIQSRWDKQWQALGVDPIPKDETASIIINKSFFVNSYLKGAFNAKRLPSQCIAIDHKSIAGQSGCLVELTWSQMACNGVKVNKGGYLWIKDRTINPNEGGEKTKIAFGQFNGSDRPPVILGIGSYRDYIQFESEIASSGGMGEPMWTTKDNGTTSGTYSINTSVDVGGNLSQEAFTASIAMLVKDWNYTKDPHCNTWLPMFNVPLPKSGGNWDSQWSMDYLKWEVVTSQTVLPHVSPMAGTSFTFDFGALKFLSITNVLQPGRKVVDIDLGAGLRIPNDVVVVGKIVKDTSPL